MEEPVVEHQAQRRVAGLVLNAEEPFAGVVGLHVVHVGRGDEPLVLFPVRGEGYASVEKDFEIGPYLFQMRLARKIQYAPEHREHPGWHAAQVGHVFAHRLPGDPVPFFFKISQQRRLFPRHAHPVGQRIDVFHQNGAQIAHQ